MPDGTSLIQCYCGSSTPDGLNNLECSSCGFYVHGACYRLDQGPVVCAPCSIAYDKPCSDPATLAWYRKQSSINMQDREEFQNKALIERLVLALTQGEHYQFFGFGSQTHISHIYLRLKFNIDQILAEKLLQLAIDRGILKVGSGGVAEFSDLLVGKKSYDDISKDTKTNSEGMSEVREELAEKSSEELKPDREDPECERYESSETMHIRFPKLSDAEDETDDVQAIDEELENKKFTIVSKNEEVLNDDDLENMELEAEIKMETLEDNFNLDPDFGDMASKKGKKRPGRPKIEGPFNCDLCSYVSATKANVRKHRQSVHEKIRYPCPVCDHSATKKDHLKQHILSKHEGVRYNCNLCEFSSPDPSTLRKHKIHKHEGKKYYCDQCDFIAARQGVLNIHIKSKHEGVTYMCDQCPYQANCKSRLQHHKNSKHEMIRYPCDQCSYQAQKNSDLNQHKRRVHEKVRFLCDMCEYSACTSYILKIHKESRHEGKMHPCHLCNFTSQYSYKTKHHILTAHEGYRYSCEHCSYQATCSSNMLRHKKKIHKDVLEKFSKQL